MGWRDYENYQETRKLKPNESECSTEGCMESGALLCDYWACKQSICGDHVVNIGNLMYCSTCAERIARRKPQASEVCGSDSYQYGMYA